MKVKLSIKINDEVVSKIGKINQEDKTTIVEYKESPTATTKLYCTDQKIRVVKTGPVEIDYTHKLGKTIECFYKVNMGEQSFKGSSKIKTTKIEVANQKIYLEYKRDGEKVVQSWEY